MRHRFSAGYQVVPIDCLYWSTKSTRRPKEGLRALTRVPRRMWSLRQPTATRGCFQVARTPLVMSQASLHSSKR